MIGHGEILEDSAFVLLARVADQTGTYIQQAGITSIQVKVINVPDSVVTATYNPVVNTVVSNSLILDARWQQDALGYNCAITIPGSATPTGDRTYRVEAQFVPTSGNSFIIAWNLQCHAVLGNES